jgi:phosphodiesterase/alkaline phosphatase D-like protein
VVEYGLNNKLKDKVALDTPDTMHEVPLKNLRPNTRYFYKVTTKDSQGRTLSSELLTFCTAVDSYSAFSFGVIGDTQKNPKVTGQVAKLIWERRPNFVIHVGDVVDNGPDKKEWVHELFGPSAPLLARVAVFPAIGNHERNHAHYYKYFSLPKPEYYYRYRYGNADFFVVDSNKSLKPGTEQYQWLDRELAKSDAKWKFAYHHHPAYSSDDDDYGNTWRGDSTFGDMNARNLVTLYEKHNVDVVFNGHIHVYERSWPVRAGKVDRKTGVVYVTSGGGGGSLENFAPNRTWFQAEVRVDYHFCHVTIHGGRLNFKAFDKDGRLFDFFEINK